MKNWKKVVMYAVLTLEVVAGTITLKGSELSVEAAQNEQGITSDFIRGADISSVLSFENAGQKFYYSDGTQGDIFDILQEAGINYVRLRVWNNPYDSVSQKGYGGGNCDLNKAIELGKRATTHGMKVLVDFQYSDFWADPSKQYAPKEWANYTATQKADAIYNFTYSSLLQMINSGVDVGMVQIGNETNGSMCGMGGLYDGVWNLSTGVGTAMKKGCEAVNAINNYFGLSNDSVIKKALHFTDPNTTASWYAEQAKLQGIDYDVFAVSAYPFWHGSPEALTTSLKNIAATYQKEVMIAETAYPYTFVNSDSTGNNINSLNDMSFSGYDISVSGQYEAIKNVFLAVAAVNTQTETEGYGLGGFYWEPTWIGTDVTQSGQYGTGFASSTSGNYELLFKDTVQEYSLEDKGSSWDNMAMFDADGKALESLQVFNSLKYSE